jgi:geranylgeranyl diphosphate synthase type II
MNPAIQSAASRAEAFLDIAKKIVETEMEAQLPQGSVVPQNLHAAMRYSMFAGGKRLRPALVLAAYQAFGGQADDKAVRLAMAALEMLHTFSLIHDDLPCMDDDDFRRGQPTAHKAFGEACAVLSGDALCIYAFELLASTGNAKAVEVLARSLGTFGMIGGQIVDIESEGQPVDLATVDYIHYHKTAALIEASLVAGALLAGAQQESIQRMEAFGHTIGLAFQIVDDILDIESTTEELGKDAGSDIENGKATYPSVVGLERSKERAMELYETSLAQLGEMDCETERLSDIAAFIVARVK